MSRARSVYLDTLGCEKNIVDSEGALGLLLQRGFRLVEDPAQARLVVVNTCGFLASAREESLERLRELAALKGEDGLLVAMGCFVQGGTHDIRRLVPGVDHVLGVGQYHRLGDLLEGAEAGPLGSPDEAPYAGYGARRLLTPPHRAHLKLAEGCNQSCAFCKIPLLRGRQRSRPVDELVAEAARLVEQGVRELVLIAQNSSAYGIDLPGRPRLGALCRELATLAPLRWIRVMYAYPPMFTDRLAEEVFSVAKVASYLDIPIQHASPRILERMDRGYDPPRLRRQLERVRALRPDIMLRSTALLGFPGEEEEDVVALLDFLAELQFDHLGTFVYSHEAGTPSFSLEDDVDPSEKEDRRARVEQLQWDIGARRRARLLDRPLEVIVDEIHVDAHEAGLAELAIEEGIDPSASWLGPVAFGRSQGFCPEVDGGLWFPAAGLAPGDFVQVRPVACGPYDLLALRVGGAEGRGRENFDVESV